MSIISVKGLSKQYRLGATAGHDTLRDTIAHGFKSLFRRDNSAKENGEEILWALRDVSFDVKEGEVLGIIGRNGAGKSTLLKILSRITEPTEGEIRIKGRVASLLEVGTGFHGELTGRENILLNGVILGMSREEIKRKFDEIAAFSEIEKFLDTPVKRYSSGMYVRLAFAVAAHLEPEILIVDEVLAVGDAGFQKKCIGKMENVSKEGRTVLFVSHNLAAVENLCSRVCLLNNGELLFDGDVAEGLSNYGRIMESQALDWSFRERQDRQGSGVMKIVTFQILDDAGRPVHIVKTGKNYTFRFEYILRKTAVSEIDFGFTIRDMRNVNLFRNRTIESGLSLPAEMPERGYLDCSIPRFPLTEGRYGFGFRLLVNGIESDYITGNYAAFFDVENADYFGTGHLISHAPIVIDHKWSVSDIADE